MNFFTLLSGWERKKTLLTPTPVGKVLPVMQDTTTSSAKTYYGNVLAITENNGYNDSDFFAIVWDEEDQRVKSIEDGTTRFAAPSKYHKADASPEVRAKADNWLRTVHLPPLAKQSLIKQRTSLANLQFGEQVVIVKGRKFPIGTKGEVFGVYANQFYRDYSRKGWAIQIKRFDPKSKNVGIRLSDGSRIFTSLANVERLSIAIPTEEEISREVKSLASHGVTSIFSGWFAFSLYA